MVICKHGAGHLTRKRNKQGRHDSVMKGRGIIIPQGQPIWRSEGKPIKGGPALLENRDT